MTKLKQILRLGLKVLTLLSPRNILYSLLLVCFVTQLILMTQVLFNNCSCALDRPDKSDPFYPRQIKPEDLIPELDPEKTLS
jgi:hypothetical protein